MTSVPDMSIFDENDSTKLSPIWIDFLNQTVVNCPVTVNPPPSGAGGAATSSSPSLVCNSPQFWNLEFDTAENNDHFQITDYNVGGSVILGLSPKQVPSPTTPGLVTILDKFGLVQDSSTKTWASGGIVDTIINNITSGLASLNLDTTAGARNAMWLTPGQTLRLDTAIGFEPVFSGGSDSGILSNISAAVLQEFNLGALEQIASPMIFLQRTCYGNQSTNTDGALEWNVITTCRLTFRITFGGLWFWITYEPAGMSLSVTQNTDQQLSGPGFWSKLDGLSVGFQSSSIAPTLTNVLSNDITLLNFSAGKDVDGVWWTVNMALQWGRSDASTSKKTPVQIFFSYDSRTSTFSGGLITSGFYATALDKLLPTYRPGTDIDQPANITVPDSWDLTQLCGETDNLPKSLPTSIATAEIEYSLGDSSDPGCLTLLAKLVNPNSRGTDYVPMPFTWDELDLELYKGAGFYFSAGAYFTLNAQDGIAYPPAHMGLNISYDSTGPTYVLMGYVNNLYLGLLWGFFDQDPLYNGPLLSALGKLEIVTLQAMYTYDSGLASSFCFTGIIALGPLQLRMFYQYASSKAGSTTAAHKVLPSDGPQPQTVQANPDGSPRSDWFFECDLEATGTGATIATIVEAISDDAAGALPSFVGGISIPTAGGRSPVSIKVAKTDAGLVLFVLRIAIEPVTLMFIQVASKGKTKRMLRFSIDKIPLLDKVPLLDQLPQPFDEMEYYWVNGPEGFLESEVTALNTTQGVLEGEDALLYKASTGAVRDPKTGSPAAGPIPDTVVIQPGHHFVVIQNKSVAIDHVFNASAMPTPPLPPPGQAALTPPASSGQASSNTPPDPAPSAPAKGAVATKLGPLSITAVTLQYKEQASGGQKILSVVLDATFAMGPMSFSLLGFSIGVPLSGSITLDNLKGLASQIVVNLQGLSLDFNNPPLLIAGGFEHEIVPDGEIYMGGLGISFPPYTFIGVGEYKILNNYKSVFIYAKLDGPIITLELASIEGVRLGFGYNSAVRSPDIDQITSFPFIDDAGISGAGNDPMAILKSLVEQPADEPWVAAKQDAYWFAAGMSITAFDILDVTAVAMFAFRDSGPIISIFADAVAQMPPGVKSTTEMIVYVEIGLVAEMNFVDGYFRVEASLAPTSFLLVPQCHIYGGFALVYWFSPNEHAGDWVFSIGGYHKNYTPNAWYPVPKRIGISFSIGILQITGEAYFAITPKVAMGGAMIHASLSFGPISAWLDASLDALVNFHPLHYIADFSVSIGVTFDIDVWFIHIHISASVGAWLHIEGPELGGNARVDFYLFGFTVDFGATIQAPPPLDLLQFWEMLHTPGPSSSPSDSGADPDPPRGYLTYNEYDSNGKALKARKDGTPLPLLAPEQGAALKFVLENGNYPQPTKSNAPASTTATPPSTGAGAKWFVRGGSFSFRIASDFAFSHADILAPQDGEEVPIALDAPAAPLTQPIYARPMRVTQAVTSILTVTIHEKDAPFTVIGNWQSVQFAIKQVPAAVWGPYSQALDPIFTSNPKDLLNGTGGTTPLAMSLMISAPPPELALSTIPVFKATSAANFGVLDFRVDAVNGTDWILAKPLAKQITYLAAPLTTAENALIDAGKLNDLWDERQKTWQDLDTAQNTVADSTTGTASVNLTSLIIGQVTDLMGWGTNRPQTEAVTSPPLWALNGATPMKLVKNLKNTYLALPRMALPRVMGE